MSVKFRVAAAVLVPGWLFALGAAPAARAGETMSGAPRPNPPIELCEAFPWDVPVEQSFSAAARARWRHAHAMRARRVAAASGSLGR